MAERFTDATIASIIERAPHDGQLGPTWRRVIIALADEVRERRAADLTPDAEAAAFQRGRDSVAVWAKYAQPTLTADELASLREVRELTKAWLGPSLVTALAVIDKLLAIGGARG